MTPRRLFTALILILCLGLPAVVALAQPGTGNATVEIRPPSGAFLPGDEFDVEVWATEVDGLYGADIQLRFDSARLAVIGAAITPRGDLLQPDFVVRQQVDNTAGTIWYAATQLAPTAPASGSGALFSFRFKVLDDGITRVAITNHVLANRDAEIIPSTVSDAVYQLGDARYELLLPVILRN